MNLKQILEAWKSRFTFKPEETKADPTIKFVLLTSPAIADGLKRRVVCDVTEYHPTHPLVGRIASWRGSTETEYFSIVFVKGMLTVSVAERECHVADTEHTVNYAMTDNLKAALDKATGGGATAALEARYDYEKLKDPEEQAKISFADVMTALDWRYKEGVKIDHDVLMD
jgi:hypothetical protein